MKIKNILKIAASVMLLFFFACNPYKHIAKRNPATHKDSVALAKVCLATFKVDTTIQKGAIEYINANDSTAYFQSVIDSLELVKKGTDSLYFYLYRDTCTSINDVSKKKYSNGYSIGYYQGKKDCIPDTLKISYYINDNREITIAKDSEKKEKDRADKLDKKLSKRNTWIMALCSFILLLLIAGYFTIRYLIKSKVK